MHDSIEFILKIGCLVFDNGAAGTKVNDLRLMLLKLVVPIHVDIRIIIVVVVVIAYRVIGHWRRFSAVNADALIRR